MKLKKYTASLLSMALFVSALGMNGSQVMAAETDAQNGVPYAETPEVFELGDLPLEFGNPEEIRQQTPVAISDFSQILSEAGDYKIGNKISISQDKMMDIPSTLSDISTYQVVAGQGTDYLLKTGDMKLFSLQINPGVYLQAQLTQPANPDLDYDLYVLDAEGYIVSAGETYTNINGTNGTLQESVGYMTSGTEANIYYLAAVSSNGGSANQAFTIQYSVSNVYDQWEHDENPSEALPFTFGTDGAFIEARTLSSPIDNDWYVINIPSDRIYDELTLRVGTASKNTCRFEVYQNSATSGYKMVRKASSTGTATINVTTGIYYIRVLNDKTMEQFDDTDIQNYTFTVIPKLRPEGILLTELAGNEGVNFYVRYPGYSKAMFRTKGWISATGYVTATDKVTGEKYGVGGHSVTATYLNPNWEANNTPDFATRTGTDTTGNDGKYSIRFDLPPAMGVETWNAGLTTQYFDICGFQVRVTQKPTISYSEAIVHYLYSLYN